MKRNLTDKFVRNVKPAAPGKRDEHWDTAVPGFGVRVTDRGAKSYVVYTRWPGSGSPSRRTIGDATRLPLAAGRKMAREWLELVAQRIDPRERDRAQAIEAQRTRQTTFGSVANDWFADVQFKELRKAAEIERCVRREFVERWNKLPITEITAAQIRNAVKDKADGLSPVPGTGRVGPARSQARSLLGYVKTLFSWAVEQHVYGITVSPAAPLRTLKLLGKKKRGTRVLTGDELRALWKVADRLKYPYGPVIKLLMLTGQRRSEVAKARWEEFDFRGGLWTIPDARMKMKKAHEVPLNKDVMDVLEEVPRFAAGNHLFSTTFGERPVIGFSKAKERVNALMLEELGIAPPHWTFHDIRRTVRTGLSPLPIQDHVRELVIAHAPSGMHAVYDHHHYREEKREALELWAASLRETLMPPAPSNVVSLRRAV
jgi:integrase